jgi:hypothetical protein
LQRKLVPFDGFEAPVNSLLTYHAVILLSDAADTSQPHLRRDGVFGEEATRFGTTNIM